MNNLIQILTNNIAYKLAALGIAIVIWSIVQGEEIIEINRRLNVFIDVPDGYMIRGDQMRTKDVTLRFPRFIQTEISSRNFEATIKIPAGKVGEHRFRIDKEYIKDWDSRIKLLVHDAYVVVNIDEAMIKEVPVKEVLQGAPTEGYNLEKVVIKPATVKVKGLKSEVEKLNEVVSEVIDVTGIKETQNFKSTVIAQNLSTKIIEPAIVELTVQIGESKVNHKFDGIPVDLQGSDYLGSVKPSSVSITLQSTPKILSEITKDDLQAYVEVRGLLPGQYSRPVQVKIPSDTVLIDSTPPTIKVEIYNQKRIH